MTDHIHINITWARERARTILLSRKKLKIALVTGVVLLCASLVGIIVSARLLVENSNLNAQVIAMNLKLKETVQESRNYADRVDDLLSQTNSQVAAFQAEKEALVDETLAEFNERNQQIENIMKSLGVRISQRKPLPNSGGPYLPSSQSDTEDLLLRTDKNLDILRHTPLGRPLPGMISSPFGNREDPITGERAFHSGVDMQARRGEKIKATADGIVIEARYDGDYGNRVEVRHGNGFTTVYAHLQSFKVKVGDRVKRGQVIGLVGSTGRSTGAHLHYELCLNGKAINPAPFMQTAALSKIAAVKTIRVVPPKKVAATSGQSDRQSAAPSIEKGAAIRTVAANKTKKKLSTTLL